MNSLTAYLHTRRLSLLVAVLVLCAGGCGSKDEEKSDDKKERGLRVWDGGKGDDVARGDDERPLKDEKRTKDFKPKPKDSPKPKDGIPKPKDSNPKPTDSVPIVRPKPPMVDGEVGKLIREATKGEPQEKVKAIGDLAGLGEKAKSAAWVLCELAVSPDRAINGPARDALEKVHPKLFAQVNILIVDAQPNNHLTACGEIGKMGIDGRGAVPVLFNTINDTKRFDAYYEESLDSAAITTLSRVAPDEESVARLILGKVKAVNGAGEPIQGVRKAALAALGTIARYHADRKPFLEALLAALNDAPTALSAVNALPGCGPEARVALAPLKVLKRDDPSQEVRTAAENSIARIELQIQHGIFVEPDPGTLERYLGMIGYTYTFEVTGSKGYGGLWGTDVYTYDSKLAPAAVHAGVLDDGQKGLVKVTILAGESKYEGTERNGVTSLSYGPYGCSYKVERYKK